MGKGRDEKGGVLGGTLSGTRNLISTEKKNGGKENRPGDVEGGGGRGERKKDMAGGCLEGKTNLTTARLPIPGTKKIKSKNQEDTRGKTFSFPPGKERGAGCIKPRRNRTRPPNRFALVSSGKKSGKRSSQRGKKKKGSGHSGGGKGGGSLQRKRFDAQGEKKSPTKNVSTHALEMPWSLRRGEQILLRARLGSETHKGEKPSSKRGCLPKTGVCQRKNLSH